MTNTSWGMTAASLKSGEPQAEQKWRLVSPPWSVPVVENEGACAEIRRSRDTTTGTENGLPVWR